MALNLFERAIFVRRTVIGKELPDPALRVIAEVVREERYVPEAVIALEDDPGDDILLVVSGTIVVRKLGRRPADGAGGAALGKIVGTFGPDDVLGEIAVLDEQPRSASMIAADEVVVLALHREDLRDA